MAGDEPDIETVLFNRRDYEAGLRCIHPEIHFHPVSSRAMGRTEPFVGHDGMREYFALVEREWEKLELRPVRVQQAADVVTVIGEAHLRGPGGEATSPTIWTWRMRDGLIGECRVHSDTAAARAALGLEAPRP